MKKIMSIRLTFWIVFSLLIAIPIKVQASSALEISTGGSISKVTYSLNNNSEEVRIFSPSTKVTKQYLIAPEGSINNYRLCFEIENADVSRSIKFDINKGTIVQIRLANFSDPKRTSVVVETTKKPVYSFSTSSDGKAIILTLGSSTSPTNTPSPSNTTVPSPTPTPKPAPSPVVTPKPITTPKPANTQNEGNGGVSSPTTNIKTSNGPLSWVMSGDSCSVNLNGISLTQANKGNMPRFEIREKEKMLQITIPGKDSRFTEGFLSGNSVIHGALVNYNLKQDSTIIRIPYKNSITYSHTVSGGSSKFVIKAGKASIPVTSPVPSPSPVTTPKPSSSPKPSTQPSIPEQPSSGASPMNNLKAGNDDGKTALKLTGSGIVDKYHRYRDKIIVDDTGSKGTVTFMIPINIINLGTGTVNINDSLIKSVDLLSTASSTFLTINKKDANKKFEIVAGSGANELLVVVSTGTGNVSDSKLVVIDPGHGGSDPGAVFGKYYEKVYNLDIALRCEKILKSKGVNVVLTRTVDKSMGLDERVKFANERSAYVFVSIHNNSMPSGIKGSMVLYHYTSYRGKPYAKIMCDNLVKDLKTANIGIQGRQNTVVLRDTKMPAILAEVACMSDAGDLELLNTESFKQKAAESIANSIIQILGS